MATLSTLPELHPTNVVRMNRANGISNRFTFISYGAKGFVFPIRTCLPGCACTGTSQKPFWIDTITLKSIVFLSIRCDNIDAPIRTPESGLLHLEKQDLCTAPLLRSVSCCAVKGPQTPCTYLRCRGNYPEQYEISLRFPVRGRYFLCFFPLSSDFCERSHW